MQMKKYVMIILTALCMLIMILLGQRATAGAREGVELCLRAVIPSLFPFFVVSVYLNGQLSGINLRMLRPVESLCGMPGNSGSILLLGLLGGYPVGAQSIAQWYESKVLSASDAQRLLGFCNNPGPAFIFGMLSAYFPSQAHLWALWSVQILSAVLTGVLLPGRTDSSCRMQDKASITLPQAVVRSVRSILVVCGWVILFRTLLSLFSNVPKAVQIPLTGFLELTNGCAGLHLIASIKLRFIAASAFLSFGGLCVHMQTISSINGLSLKYYAVGKVLQTVISLVLSVFVQEFFLRDVDCIYSTDVILIPALLLLFTAVVIFLRKNSSICKENVIQYRK